MKPYAVGKSIFDSRAKHEARVGRELDEMTIERCACGALRIVGRPSAVTASSACTCGPTPSKTPTEPAFPAME